jgi:hypothetical protein
LQCYLDANQQDQPCHQCLKRAFFNEALASRLCFGYDTKAWEIRASIKCTTICFNCCLWLTCYHLDFFGPYRDDVGSFDDLKLRNRRKIKLYDRPFSIEGRVYFQKQSYLEIEIDDLYDPSLEEIEQMSQQLYPVVHDSLSLRIQNVRCNIQTIKRELFSYCSPLGFSRPRWELSRIADTSLPSAEMLLSWGFDNLIFRAEYIPENLSAVLDGLLLKYLAHTPNISMV